jgi:hypothetical protein
MARPSPATGLRPGGQASGFRPAGQAGRLRSARQSGSVLDPVGVRSSRRRRHESCARPPRAGNARPRESRSSRLAWPGPRRPPGFGPEVGLADFGPPARQVGFGLPARAARCSTRLEFAPAGDGAKSRVPGRCEQETPALLGNALADRRPSGRRSTAARCTFDGGSPPPETRQWVVGDAQQKTGLLSPVPSVPVAGLRLGGQASGFRPAGWQTGFGSPARTVRCQVPSVPATGLRLGGQASGFRPAGRQTGFGSPARTVRFQVPATPPKGPRVCGRERRGTRSGRSSLLPLPELPPCAGIREQLLSVSVGSRGRARRTFGSDQFFASRPARSAGRLRATSGSPSGARRRETGSRVECRGSSRGSHPPSGSFPVRA